MWEFLDKWGFVCIQLFVYISASAICLHISILFTFILFSKFSCLFTIFQPQTVELPPSYESLFMSESPPSYNVAASEAETDQMHEQQQQQQSVEAEAVEDSEEAHCQCDCDHSKCLNASK